MRERGTQKTRHSLQSRIPERIVRRMKTAAAQQVPQQWPQILQWLAADEEIQVTQDDRVVARILPATDSPAPATPDFLARAQAVWGANPTGPALSALVSESRGEGA